MWPGFFIEALEGRLNGCTGGDERDRGALMPTLFVAPLGLGKLALSVLDVVAGYGVVPVLDDFLPWAATGVCEHAFGIPFPHGCAKHVLDAILDEAVVWVLFHEEPRAKRKSLTAR